MLKSPHISVTAKSNKFPKLCPESSPRSNLKSSMLRNSLSFSARATMQLRTSPGGSIPHSLRILPELPPSSVTATTAVMFLVKALMPRSSVESPVPPPTAIMYGPLDILLLSTGFPDFMRILPKRNSIASVVIIPRMKLIIIDVRVLCPCELRILPCSSESRFHTAILQLLPTCAVLLCSQQKYEAAHAHYSRTAGLRSPENF